MYDTSIKNIPYYDTPYWPPHRPGGEQAWSPTRVPEKRTPETHDV